MITDVDDLYQQVIIDHSKRPRCFYAMEGADGEAEGFNPLCGDRIKVFLKMDGDVIDEISFQGSGCAISTASASLLGESLKGKTSSEAEALFRRFHDLVTGKPQCHENVDLGKLEVFSGVSNYPVRVKCATLCWHTLRAALAGRDDVVSTE